MFLEAVTYMADSRQKRKIKLNFGLVSQILNLNSSKDYFKRKMEIAFI